MNSPFDTLAARPVSTAGPLEDFDMLLDAGQESSTAILNDVGHAFPNAQIPNPWEQAPPVAPTPEKVQEAVESAARFDPKGLAAAVSSVINAAKPSAAEVAAHEHPYLVGGVVLGLGYLVYRTVRSFQ